MKLKRTIHMRRDGFGDARRLRHNYLCALHYLRADSSYSNLDANIRENAVRVLLSKATARRIARRFRKTGNTTRA
jgi:hypothetical protein